MENNDQSRERKVVLTEPKKETDKVPIDDSIPKGHVLLAEVDKDGKEIPNSEFHVLERAYKKRYSDTKKYILKKKAKR